MATTNQPKVRRSTGAGMRPARRPPSRLPAIAAAVTAVASGQGIWTVLRCPAGPAADCRAMASRLVPMASVMARPPSRVRAGTMRNPPPAPISPAITPITAPAARVRGSDGWRPAGGSERRLRGIAVAVASIITAKPVSSTPSGMCPAT